MSLIVDEHREYLADAPRVRAFRDALRARVKPGDVVVDLGAEGYLPSARRTLSVTSTPDPEPYVIELARGVPVELRFLGQSEGLSPLAGHLVFLVERAQLASIDGPFPSQGPPSNHRINGICMRIDDLALMNQLLTGDFYETGRARFLALWEE